MTLKHFLKRQNRSKNKIGKITVKSRNDEKCLWSARRGLEIAPSPSGAGVNTTASPFCVVDRI